MSNKDKKYILSLKVINFKRTYALSGDAQLSCKCCVVIFNLIKFFVPRKQQIPFFKQQKRILFGSNIAQLCCIAQNVFIAKVIYLLATRISLNLHLFPDKVTCAGDEKCSGTIVTVCATCVCIAYVLASTSLNLSSSKIKWNVFKY